MALLAGGCARVCGRTASHRLRHEQRRIRHAKAHAKADGVVTPHEKRHLDAMQNQAGRHIRSQKRDTQAVPPKAMSAP